MPKVIPGYKEEVKKRIIKAAIEAAYEKGFSAVKMGDISKKLGISRSTLYIYFKNRDEVIREILSYIRSDMVENIRGSLEEKSLEEAFSNIFNDFIFNDENFRGGIVFEIFAQVEHDERLKALITEHYINLGKAISDILVAQKKSNKIPEDIDVEIAAKTIQTLIIGIKATSMIGLEKEQALVIWEETIKKVLGL